MAQRSASLPSLGSAAGDSSAHVSSYPYIERNDRTVLDDSSLTALNGGVSYSALVRAGSLAPSYCGETPTLMSGEITLRLDLGDDYEFGKTGVNTSIDVTIKGVNSGGTVKFQRNVSLYIDSTRPEQVYRLRIAGAEIGTTGYTTVTAIRVFINGYSAASPAVKARTRLTAAYRDEWAIDAGPVDDPLVELIPLRGVITTNPVTFEWKQPDSCNDVFPNYEFQLLRLYNTDTSAAYAYDTTVHTEVDWSRALTLETGDSNRSLTLTIAEGTGYYLWRVRPIGSLYPGGAANNWNWGAWSMGSSDGDDVSFEVPPMTGDESVFFYQQFEQDRIWQYGRGFTEGTKIAEGMIFANSLGQTVQSQMQVRSADSMMVGQTLYDYEGRAALGSLPVPVDTGAFRYVQGMTLHNGALYSAANFDAATTFRNPDPVNEGYVADYYSNSNSDPGVPNANRYPFTRSLPSLDGTGRIEQQGGPGAVYRIGGGAGGSDRTPKVYYSSVSNDELIRIFGDEAPIDTNVIKQLAIDPNKVVTIQYATIDGQVIATCVQADDSNPLLLGLEETERLDHTVSDTISGARMRGAYSFNASKRFGFAKATEVTIRYRLQADTLHDSYCGLAHCATCDYRVRIFLHNIDNPDSSVEQTFILGADPCGSGQTIDTTFTVTVPAGTYIVEKRVESNTIDPASITADDSVGSTYAEIYRRSLANQLDSLVRSSDTLSQVLGFLESGDLDSLYGYLDVDPDSVAYKIIDSECCQIRIPIIPRDCEVDPCRDTVPDFEGYLVDTWGSEFGGSDPDSLNNYFRHDGVGRYPTDPFGRFIDGKGAFNFMIARMLQEADSNSQPIYECKNLWRCWSTLVQNYKLMAIGPDGSSYTPDFDLLETFLSCAGPRYQDTATVLYDTTRSPLLYAYKFVSYPIGRSPACELAADYDASWHGEPDSSYKWQQLLQCSDSYRRRRSSIFSEGCTDTVASDERDECLLQQKLIIENSCRSDCESHRTQFYQAVVAAFDTAGLPRPRWDTLECMTSALLDSCKASCSLTVHYNSVDEHIDSIGTYLELRTFRDIKFKRPKVTLPNTLNQCPDSAHHYDGEVHTYDSLIVQRLRERIRSARVNVDGEFLIDTASFPPIVRGNFLTNSVFLPAVGRNANPRFEIRNGCELWYVCDTMFFTSPERPHALISHLNGFLDGVWGYTAYTDSTSTYETFFARTEYDDPPYTYRIQVDTGHRVIASLGAKRGNFEDRLLDGINGSATALPVSRYVRTSLDTFGISRDTSVVDPASRFSGFRRLPLSPTDPAKDHVFGFGDTVSTNAPMLRGQVQGGGGTLDYVDANLAPSHYDINEAITHIRFINRWKGVTGPDSLHNVLFETDRGLELAYFTGSKFTRVAGKFEEDEDHYLVYRPARMVEQKENGICGITDLFLSTSGEDTVVTDRPATRIFNIRFYKTIEQKVADSICEPLVCPAACFQWVDRPAPEYSNIDTIRPQPCAETALIRIRNAIENQMRGCIDAKLTDAEAHYREVCASPDSLNDLLHVDYPIDYFHFTLYYYDRTGNLIRTVPPAGVQLLTEAKLGHTPTRLDSARHRYDSRFEYNSLGQITRTYSPDGNTVRFWYDYLGRLRYAQDRQQQIDSLYSYMKYDYLGRPVESGVSSQGWSGTDTSARTASNLDNPLYPSAGSQRVYTVYTTPASLTYPDGRAQKNLRNRVSYDSSDDGARTVYSYDIHGNVEWVGSRMPGFPFDNFVRYEYELVSGNMMKVHYNEGRADQLHHWYLYDQDNRLSEVRTSRDSVIWDSDARYHYSARGSLDRIELGEDKLQGLDYTYTLQGNLKAVNHPSLDQSNDPGADGASGDHELYPADSFSVALGYYKGDFNRTGAFDSSQATSLHGVQLYDGNISSVTSHIGHRADAAGLPLKYEKLTGEVYRYDLLGRLDSSQMKVFNGTGWDTTSNYATRYRHDPNGNLLTLERKGYDTLGGLRMDSLTYVYSNLSKTPNSLNRVQDAVTGASQYSDIKNGQANHNYKYDSTGNLTRDSSEGGMNIEWNANGKVKQITTLRGTNATDLTYSYDAGGNVVRSQLRQNQFGSAADSIWNTWYAYDAGGTVMAIYQQFCPNLDTDNDGVIDSEDNCPLFVNGGQDDGDGDGVGNSCDNCVGGYNPAQEDLDNDGIGDFCETDTDGDGILNAFDNCIFVANPSQADSNFNAIGDACETAGGLDSDRDGIPDLIDKCPNFNNPSQIDSDGDGVGDVCDNCPSVANHNQIDRDNNGVGDACQEYCGPVMVELPVYGHDRLATIYAGQIVPDSTIADSLTSRHIGQKFYELQDHLGNVRVVMSDIKLPLGAPGSLPFEADVRAYSNMYPYGMQQPYRSFSPGMYRYGYNGMEAENRIKDTANHHTTYFRAYDSRLGRFWGIDPVVKPGESPYSAMGANPILLSDLSGANVDTSAPKQTGDGNQEVRTWEETLPGPDGNLYLHNVEQRRQCPTCPWGSPNRGMGNIISGSKQKTQPAKPAVKQTPQKQNDKLPANPLLSRQMLQQPVSTGRLQPPIPDNLNDINQARFNKASSIFDGYSVVINRVVASSAEVKAAEKFSRWLIFTSVDMMREMARRPDFGSIFSSEAMTVQFLKNVRFIKILGVASKTLAVVGGLISVDQWLRGKKSDLSLLADLTFTGIGMISCWPATLAALTYFAVDSFIGWDKVIDWASESIRFSW